MSIRDDLIAARALIDTPEKWGKGDGPWAPPLGDVNCAETACSETNKENRYALWGALETCLPDGFESIHDFNDHPDTTHADVMALFDQAIAACEVQP